jgi:hypothetical protein
MSIFNRGKINGFHFLWNGAHDQRSAIRQVPDSFVKFAVQRLSHAAH